MGTKRYIVITLAFILAVVADAFIFTVLLDTPYSRVPMKYHILNIIVLTPALALIGDMIFKAGVVE
ncbi:MAG: hypothetical protein GXP42_10105 [Chloroflexi bacterium]|nr:hypothetical protein [Chloroflexota bacterium]